MKLRILSGNQRGAVVEMDQPAGEAAIGSGYAELYVEATEAPAEPAAPPKAAPKKTTKTTKKK